MPRIRVKLPGSVRIVKCLCGNSNCRTYFISWGTFYQGSGWEETEAKFIARAINEKINRQRKVNDRKNRRKREKRRLDGNKVQDGQA